MAPPGRERSLTISSAVWTLDTTRTWRTDRRTDGYRTTAKTALNRCFSKRHDLYRHLHLQGLLLYKGSNDMSRVCCCLWPRLHWSDVRNSGQCVLRPRDISHFSPWPTSWPDPNQLPAVSRRGIGHRFLRRMFCSLIRWIIFSLFLKFTYLFYFFSMRNYLIKFSGNVQCCYSFCN